MKTKNYIFLFACYFMWGFMPIYLNLIPGVDAFLLLACKIIWAAIFSVVLLAIKERLNDLWAVFKNPQAMKYIGFSAFFMLMDAGLYIYAVQVGRVLDTSLGYYLCPLLMFCFGVMFFKERCRWFNIMALVFALVGIGEIAISNRGGSLFISIGIAFAWALCSLGRKKANTDASIIIAAEMLLLTPLSILFILFFRMGSSGMSSMDLPLGLYFIGAGILTAVPALIYVSAINKLSFITMAFAQYLTPTFGMICGFLLGETMSGQTLFGFAFIWAGLLIYTTASVIYERTKMKEDAICKKKSQENPPLTF